MSLTLLELCQETIGEMASDIATPSAIVSSSDQTLIQLRRIANRVGRDLMREFEWRRLVTEYTFNTVAGTALYDLHHGFDRMIADTHYDRTNDWANLGPASSQQWQWLNTGLSALTTINWRLYLNQIQLYPTPTSVMTMAYEFVSKYWVIIPFATVGTAAFFTDDADTCIYPDDVMTLGMMYRWYKAKGLDWEDKYADYMRAKATAQAQDVPVGRKSLTPRSLSRLDHVTVPEGNWSL